MKKILAAVLVLFTFALLFVSCGKKDEPKKITEDVFNDAVEMFVEYNKPTAANSVKGANFELPSKIVDYQGFDLDVAWSVVGGNGLVSVAEGSKENTVTVKVNKYADNDTDFTMKGTVTCGEFTKDVEFKYSIAQYVIATWQYWTENVKDVTMNIKGVVVAKYPYSAENKNTGVFIQDLDGEHGYFAYRMKCDSQSAYDNDLKIGNVIEVNGTTSIYNGFREMGAGCTYNVVKNEDGSVMTGEVKKVDIEGIIGNNTALDQLQGVLCTLNGFKVKSIDWNTNKADNYYEKGAGSVYVTLTKGGKDFKIYLSTSNQLTLDELKSEYEKIAVGYTVNVEGPMSWYNAAQLYPCAGGITVVSTEVSAEDKMEEEISKISIPVSAKEEVTLTLPATGATYSEVTFEWTAPDAEGVKLEGNVLTLTPSGANAEVTLLLTVKCGGTEKKVEYTIVLVAGEMSYEDIVNAAYNLNSGEMIEGIQTLYGKIKKDDKNTYIVVGELTDKPIQLYSPCGMKVNDGDMVTVEGFIKNFKGTIEFDGGCYVIGAGEIRSQLSIVREAFNLTTDDAPMEDVTLSGTAFINAGGKSPVYYIIVNGTTEEQKIQCYKLAGAEGIDISTLENGDLITVNGKIKNYKGTIEFDNGCKVVAMKKVSDVAKELFALEDKATLGVKYMITGDIVSIDSKGNPFITFSGVEEGKSVQCYKLVTPNGQSASGLAVGDRITVYGLLMRYGSTYEFNQGCILVKHVAAADV